MSVTSSGRPRTCKICREKFKPWNTLQVICRDMSCILEYARIAHDRKRKRDLKEARDRIKTKSEHAKEAQAVFNIYIRYRDRDLPCISCGRHHTGQYHAGHYRTVGACPELRFEECNVNKQCAPCNNHKSGNIVEYRLSLIRKIGPELLEWLEGPHEPKFYRVDDYKWIKTEYRKRLKELKQRDAGNH